MKREIYGIPGTGSYRLCDVVMEDHMQEGFLLVRDPNTGHEYVAVPALGTWMAIRPYDALYRLMWLEKRVKELEAMVECNRVGVI